MRPLEEDTNLSLVTSHDEADALELVRHDYAHVLAEAVQKLFPGTQITFGPSTGDGFYYDFAPAADRGPFRDDELPLIEEEMRKIIAADLPLTREVWERDKLIAKWAAEGEMVKAEWAAELPHGEELRSEEHTSELQSLMRNSYAVFCLKKNTDTTRNKQ